MEHQTENISCRKVYKITKMLVSIVVITYNSAKYVLETLESAKVQTFQNIELIISDDCSTDNTVKICRKWIEKYKERFIRTELITAEKNTGIPANCNRGVKAANGKWIKLIAGDDILDKSCVINFLNYTFNNPDASIISSSIQLFANTFAEENFGKVINPEEVMFFYKDTSAYQQYNMLLRMNYVHGPSTMIKKAAIMDVGGFDEKYQLLEDYPMFLKLTKAGYKIYALNKVTVYYRRHNSTVLIHVGNTIFSNFYLKIRTFDLDYIYPNITVAERIAKNLEYSRLRLFDWLGLNKETFFCKLLFEVTNILNPGRAIINYGLKKSIK
jgi:glycosyltransferase involved in cell wall biosynthesis